MLFKGFMGKLCALLFVASTLAYANNDAVFMQSVNALFDEEKVFEFESKRLLDNTTQVDKALIDFETVLMTEHRTAQALITLDRALGTIEEGLGIAEKVPQIKEQSQKLKKELETIHKPVASAAKTMSSIDVKVVPLLNATQKAEKVASKLVVIEDGFRHVSMSYFDTVGLVSQCEHDDMIISIMDRSRLVYTDIDKEMKRINDTYDTVKKIPEKSFNEIRKQLEKINLLEKPLVGLHDKLEPLYHVLNDLEHILDKRIGVKPGYPCGTEICHREQSYPCGTKMCSKMGVPYPCGVKTCTEKVPYPCGVKTCHIDISMSVEDALKDSDAIENKIKSILSATAYKALKEIGLGSIIKDLENQANALVKPILSKLNLTIDTSLPKLDIDFDLTLIDAGLTDIGHFESELIKLSNILDMRSPTFSPYSQKLDAINGDIKSVLNSPRCKNVKR